ncbi:MAG TPA: PilZ domain-containing protein [Thermoanaerobaculia bacterium]|nr:PilZ domain-containing protein [Thermoanaerobaculia bacterium]
MTKQLSMDAVRRSNRYRVIMNLPVRLGLKSGTLIDISSAGVLATHSGVLKTGANVDITFVYENQRFAATAKVASCTVVGLGGGENTLYASRLYFTNLSDPARQLLEAMFGETQIPQQ